MKERPSLFAIALGAVASTLALGGCVHTSHAVIASSATTVGLELGQSASGTGATTVLGYRRGEFAYVPTNRSKADDAGSSGEGAKDVADVIMEINYSSKNGGSVHQRLAVGPTAVTQSSANLLFAKNAEGNLDAAAIQAVITMPEK